jgi:uncharacterized protein (DUF952 family)
MCHHGDRALFRSDDPNNGRFSYTSPKTRRKGEILVEAQVFKILTGPQWALWRGLGVTLGSHDDRRDGFIHFSSAAQTIGTLSKHFPAHDRLWLVRAEAVRMGPALKWEPSRSGQLFPHLYGAFSFFMASGEWPIARSEDRWLLPMECAA